MMPPRTVPKVFVGLLLIAGMIGSFSILFAQTLPLPAQAREVIPLISNGGFEMAGAGAGGALGWRGNNLSPADKRVCTVAASSQGECGFRFNSARSVTTQRNITQIYNPSAAFGNRNDQLVLGYTIKIPTLTDGTSFTVTARIDYMNDSLSPDIFTRSYTAAIDPDAFIEEEGALTLKGRADKLTVTFRMSKPGIGRVFVDRVRANLLTNLPTATMTISPSATMTTTPSNTPPTPCETFNQDLNSPRLTQCPPTKTMTPTPSYTPPTPCPTANADVNSPRTTPCPPIPTITPSPTQTDTPTNTPTNTNTPTSTPTYTDTPT